MKNLGLSLFLFFTCSISCVHARDFTLTIYDDGKACPGNCDAHVVFYQTENGTRYAYLPTSSRTAPKACIKDQPCTICFSDADNSCMTALYRGGGPKPGRFDFTPAFYQQNCPRSDIPDALRSACKEMGSAASSLGYDKRTNCIAKPDDPKCVSLIDAAKKAQKEDGPKRDACIAQGEDTYNAKQTDAKEERALDCNYSKLNLGGGGRWRKLLPAACRAGTYVDPNGLDCCTADIRFDAVNHPECWSFFPK
jgi:hypothetical protein